MAKTVYYGFLWERCNYDVACMRAAQVAATAGALGFKLLETFYQRTDHQRNAIAEAFLKIPGEPDDQVVMLDVDHNHPKQIVARLAQHGVPVVAPLMFRRGEPYQPAVFDVDAAGELRHICTYPPGLHRLRGGVGTGAICIQRRVFEQLRAAGRGPFYFQYHYYPDGRAPSEDMWFMQQCRELGLSHYVDTTFETRHLILHDVGADTFEAFLADHPEIRKDMVELQPPGWEVEALAAGGLNGKEKEDR